MAGFEDLPNEIVLEVLKIVLPEDLENLASTSKHLLLLSKPFLEEHRQLIRRYTTFNSHPPSGESGYPGIRDGFLVGPVPTLFKDVLRKPCIGHYVREVKLDVLLDIRSDFISNDKSIDAEEQYKQQYDLVDKAVAQSEVPDIREQFQEGWRKSDYDGEGLLIAITLPLLPNLNTLSIEWTSTFDFFFSETGFIGIPWLAKLKTVRVEECDESVGFSTRDLKVFSSLPSLKSLTASGYSSPEYSFANYSSAPDSHTTQLVLLNSDISTQPLYWYLESFRSLQMFTFECVLPPSDVDDKEKFDPCWIRSALVARAKATLQALTIIGPPRPDTFMGSFQPFEGLREVCVEWVFLFPDDCNLETWPSSVLPPSIHILKLLDHSDRTGREYESLIHGLQHAKKNTCLQLEKVDIALDWWEVTGELDELKDLCKQVGISLTFSNRD